MTAHEIRLRYVRIALVFYIAWVTVFVLEGLYVVTLPTRDLTTWADGHIPVLPGFVWIYVSCYVFPFITLFVVKDWHRMNRALMSIALCTLIAFVGHVAIPVAFPRPVLGSSFSAQMLAFIYDNDFKPGAQNFPSLHVAIALVIYLTCRRQGLNKPAEHAILVMAVLIILSTVLVKQHLFVDLVGGLALGIAVWGGVGWEYRRQVSADEPPLRALARMTQALMPTFAGCILLLVVVGIARALD